MAFIRDMEKGIETEKEILYSQARKYQDQYKEAIGIHNTKHGTGKQVLEERNKYWLEVSLNERKDGKGVTRSTLKIAWRRNTVIKNRKTGKVMPFHKSVPRGKGHGYRLDDFRDAPLWERELIGKIEPELTKLRQSASYLASLSRVLGMYKKGVKAGTKRRGR